MPYSKITPSLLLQLQTVVSEKYCLQSPEILQKYAQDRTEDLVFLPELVLIPADTEQISKIMRLCYEANVPVTPRSGGTGLAGGALPVCGGVLLSLERLDKILKIDEQNLQIITEPAVITEVLQNTVQEKGLYYPPDPASRGICHIGGNIATNAGGPRAVKYGVVKDYVLNLEVVLPTGEVIWTGANTLKNSTGYNLTQLMIGSEGTLGIITKIVLKLIPYPSHSLLMLVPFSSATQACAAVSAIFRAGIVPSCMEFMERKAIDIALNYVTDVQIDIPEKVQAHLIIEVDGNQIEPLYQDCEKIYAVLKNFGEAEMLENILFADDEATKNKLWKIRKNFNQALKFHSIVKKADTVVPRAELPHLLEGMHQIGKEYGINLVSYGHAGDGNLHVSLLKENLSDEHWNKNAPVMMRQIFNLVKSLNGTISGEHGIGWIQKEYLDIVFSETEMNLMRSIKKAFDPKMILNPEKIF